MRIKHRFSIGALSAFSVCSATAIAASQDNNVEWDGVFADTTSSFVTPASFNAGDTIAIRMRTRANDVTGVVARVWLNGINQEKRLPLVKATAGTLFDTWTLSLTVPAGTTQVYYRFELTDGTDTDYYDAGAPTDPWTTRGMSDELRGESYNFVLVPGFSTPAWSQQAVWYQIFPDRFYDGDASNNRVLPDDCFWYLDYAPASPEAAECAAFTVPQTPAGYSKLCEVHDSWSELPNGGPCDFFGGDIKGIRDKLGYIQDLNATAIYLNPIFRSMSNHKYDTMDYTQVDPRFGGNTSLQDLSRDSRARGLKLIADGVFNHGSDLGIQYNGWGNYAYDNGVASGYDYYSTCGAWEDQFDARTCTSPYNDWFKLWVGTDVYDVDRDGNKSEPAAHTCGWAGLEFMPDIDYKSPANPDSSARTWLYGGSKASTTAGASGSIAGQWLTDGSLLNNALDGWRLDVPDNAGYFNNANPNDCSKTANDVSIWQGFRKAVKTVGNDKLIIGEIWKDATTNGGQNWFNALTYDGVMNYHFFGMPVSCFITGKGVHNDAGECTDDYTPMTLGNANMVDALDAHLAKQRRVYPAAAYLSSQNLLSSHDTSRFLSRAGGDVNKLKVATYLQATLPGAPMIYYGDEVGVTGANNEQGRATFPWGTFDEATSQGAQLRELTRSLMCLRKTYTSLQTGSFITLWTHNGDKTYGYGRFDSKDRIAVGVNNDGAVHTLKLSVGRLDIADGAEVVDVLSGARYTVATGTVSVSIPAHSGVILVTADRATAGQACAVTNRPPTADAGPDQTLIEGEALILDGTGSSDPEKANLDYTWTDGAALVGDTAVVSVDGLAPGTYIYALTVSDGVYSDVDSVTVTVEERSGGDDGGACGGSIAGTGVARYGMFLPFAFVGFAIRRRRR